MNTRFEYMQPETIDKSALNLATLSPEGKAPKYRLADAGTTSELVQNLIYGAQPRNDKDAQAQGLRDGNPPYSRKALRDAAQSNRTNLNTGEGDALVSNGVVPYYDLLHSTRHPIEPHVGNLWEPKDRETFNRVIAEELHTLIKAWGGWHLNWWPMLNSFIWLGIGYFMFDDDEVWTFEWVKKARVLFPDDTKVDPKKWEVFITLQDMPVHLLWDKIKGQTVSGWDKEAVVESIRNALPKDLHLQEPMEVQAALNEKSFFYEASRSVTVQIANVFTREFSGKWSHLIVLQPSTGQTYGRATDTKARPAFLYEGRELYDDPNQILAPFYWDVTHENINELAGMAKKTFPLLALNNRIYCATADGTFIRAGITVQARTREASVEAALVQLGALNVIPPEYVIQNATIMGDLAAAYQFAASNRAIISGNTGVFRPQVDKEEGNPPTATEFAGRMQQATILTNSAVERFYDQADRFYQEFFRRVILCAKKGGKGFAYQQAEQFMERCTKRGIPKEAFEDMEPTMAARAVGNGSPMMRQQIMGSLAQISVKMPEDGQQNFWEEYTAVFAGQSKVGVYFPASGKQRLPNDDQAWALLENAAIKEGAPVTWTPSQNNVIHLQTHFQAASEAAQHLGDGGDLLQIYGFLDGIGHHAAAHLQELKKDPSRKDAYKVLEEQFNQLAQVTDKLRQRIEQQQQQQAERQQAEQQAQAIEQGVDPKTRIKQAETQAKIQMQREKTSAMLQMKREQHAQKMALSDAATAADIHRKHVAFMDNREKAKQADNN